ncbi:MAG: M23 family metallopeptidase [Blautia sp.]|nr:M23 family metallopeptidase [Blautia sp.]MDY4516199.1 M23 family metallopeptidase [Lachnospiraceae bacterium]
MQNKERKRFTRKQGAMVVLSLCLVGGAAFTTFYTMDRAEKAKEEQQLIDLNEEAPEEAKRNTETEAERAANANDAKADLPLANEMDVDPASLAKNEETDVSADAETEVSVDASSANIQPTVAYDDSTPLTWPVAGTVLLDYSMDATVYFPTLDQYKYNPALIIGAQTGGQVVASAKGVVESIDVNEETGTTLTLNLGNDYELVYGQLKEVTAAVGDVVEPGQLLGYVSEPTKYYCEEGSNLYFGMKKSGEPVDPFLYLDSE